MNLQFINYGKKLYKKIKKNDLYSESLLKPIPKELMYCILISNNKFIELSSDFKIEIEKWYNTQDIYPITKNAFPTDEDFATISIIIYIYYEIINIYYSFLVKYNIDKTIDFANISILKMNNQDLNNLIEYLSYLHINYKQCEKCKKNECPDKATCKKYITFNEIFDDLVLLINIIQCHFKEKFQLFSFPLVMQIVNEKQNFSEFKSYNVYQNTISIAWNILFSRFTSSNFITKNKVCKNSKCQKIFEAETPKQKYCNECRKNKNIPQKNAVEKRDQKFSDKYFELKNFKDIDPTATKNKISESDYTSLCDILEHCTTLNELKKFLSKDRTAQLTKVEYIQKFIDILKETK